MKPRQSLTHKCPRCIYVRGGPLITAMGDLLLSTKALIDTHEHSVWFRAHPSYGVLGVQCL